MTPYSPMISHALLAAGPKIGSYAVHVFAILAQHANEAGEAWPSVRRLAELTGMTDRAVRIQLRKLRDQGIIEIVERKDGAQHVTNLYKLATPYRPPERNDSTPGTKREGGTERNDLHPLNETTEEHTKKNKGSVRARFVPPSVDEVRTYCQERKSQVDPEQFVDHYTANGWRIGGRSAMKDWRAAVRTWERNGFSNGKARPDELPEYARPLE